MSASRPGRDARAAAIRSVISAVLLALLFSPTAAAEAAALVPAAASPSVVEIVGDVVLDSPTVYGEDVLVRVLPGARILASDTAVGAEMPVLVVRGALHAAGLPHAPILFQAPVHILGPAAFASIEHATFNAGGSERCQLLIDGAQATVRHVEVRGGAAGVCVESSDAAARGASEETSPLTPARVTAAGAVGPPPGSVVLEALSVRGAGVGLHLGAGAPAVFLSNSTLAGNAVGLRVEDGRAVLDHVTFDDNREWDVDAVSVQSVRWHGTAVEPSCVRIAGHVSRECERGSLPLPLLLAILGALVVLARLGWYVLTRIGSWLGLYSRIRKEEALDHPARRELLRLVTAKPGIHLRALVAALGGFGRTAYHLARLEEFGFVTSRLDGLHRRFYPAGHALDERTTAPTRERVLAAVARRPGIHPGGVARVLGLSRQLAAYHVGQLVAAGLVLTDTSERRLSLRLACAASTAGATATSMTREGSAGSPPDPLHARARPAPKRLLDLRQP